MPEEQGSILIVDDDPEVLRSSQIVLQNHFPVIKTVKDPALLREILESRSFDVVLLDMNFSPGITSGEEGIEWLKKIADISPSSHVVVMTAYGDIDLAVKAMKHGALDFVVKPWDNKKMIATLKSAYKLSCSQQKIEQLKNRQRLLSKDIDRKFSEIIGESPEIQSLFKTIEKVSSTEVNVLILGENGTGKELVARAIHRNSPRADEVFISVDMGSLSETIFESELFGHVKGAYTDAAENRKGRFEIASGGTLFLDEMGNISLSMQGKLLSSIQKKEITPLGSNKSVKSDIRLICATNKHLPEMVEKREFREDLYYRINTVEIRIPPLRERTGDIPLLAKHFADIFSKKYRKPGLRITNDAIRKLSKYSWPGNIRELQHVVERAVIMTDKLVLDESVFAIKSHKINKAREMLNLEEVEKTTILNALRKNDGNISIAAKELGLGRTTLYRKMKKYGI